MRGLFGFSIVEFVQKRKRARWISQGLEPKKIQLNNGTDLHCWVLQSKNPHTEKERPALLLIHGFGADGQTGWDDQICSLGKHFDLFIPDLIFFGESTTMSSERTEIFQAECLKSMLDCLGVESVIVVGHSYGGFVAFWMAHKYPNLVRRLVIVSSAICMMPSTNDPLLKAFGSSNIKDFLLPNDAGDLKRAMNLTFYQMPLPWIPGFLYKDMFQTMGGNKEQRAELLDALVIGTKKSRPLPTVNQDVLLIWGEKDLIFPLEEAYLLQRHIGEKAKVVVINECGHVPSFEKSTELNEALLKFLSVDMVQS